MNEHRITCEICDKETTKGIIVKDRGLRDRYFCSDKCLDKKIKKDKETLKDLTTPFLTKIINKIKGIGR